MARWINTFVAPSERSSAVAISRLSMPRANLMMSASRRSSGSFDTPSRTSLTCSRPSTTVSVSCGAVSTAASSSWVSGRRERSR